MDHVGFNNPNRYTHFFNFSYYGPLISLVIFFSLTVKKIIIPCRNYIRKLKKTYWGEGRENRFLKRNNQFYDTDEVQGQSGIIWKLTKSPFFTGLLDISHFYWVRQRQKYTKVFTLT